MSRVSEELNIDVMNGSGFIAEHKGEAADYSSQTNTRYACSTVDDLVALIRRLWPVVTT